MATKKKIIWFENNNIPSEIYQNFNLKYSFAGINKKGMLHQCHEWIQCRDFLHDVVRTHLTGNASDIYDFKFSKKNNPHISTDKIKILVSKENIESPIKFRRLLNRSLKIINFYEKLLNSDLSILEKVSNNENSKHKHVWLFTGPKFWLSAPHILSFYTLLIRLGNEKMLEIKNYREMKSSFKKLSNLLKENKIESNNDRCYLSKIYKDIKTIIINNEKISAINNEGFSELYFKDIHINPFHNSMGIVSVCEKNTPIKSFNKRISAFCEKEV